MRIVIIGAGKIGEAIVKHVSNEEHEVVIIDNNPDVIEKMVNKYDVMGICGSGVSYEIQANAGVEKSDLVIAVTASDERNMLACLVAKTMGVSRTIARVRDYNYTKQIHLMKDALGISLTINPELESSNEIMRIINFPEALKVDTFAKGNADLIELYIPEGNPLVGQPLYSIASKYQVKALVCAVCRGNEVFIPSGSFVLQAKDKIHVTASRNNARTLISKLGLSETKMKEILIIGGGRIAMYLGAELLKNRYRVKIIERDLARCEELSQVLKDATIIHGDGSDQNLLAEEGIVQSDVVVCITGIDEENIIISMYANKLNVKKVITKVNKPSFAGLLESIEMASVISPQEIAASQIVRYIRASENSRGNNIKTLYKLVNNQVEAIEFSATKSSKVLNVSLKNMKIKPNMLIAGIVRDNEVIIPNGDSMILDGDSVIVVTTSHALNDLDEILV